jgi:uncharacterized integral membrane protein (TIGR00698 family)
MFGFRKEMLSGVLFVAFFATLATLTSKIEIIKSIGFSPLVIGIVFGIIYANIFANKTQTKMQSGITFSAKKILRFAIVLYGFRLTFQDIASVGLEGFMASLIMLSSTMIIGTYFGIKMFKLNKDTSILTASGASVCGAAAVLATEPVLKAKSENVAIAVSMVVLFGTISMFLYPILYESFIKDSSGFLHMSPSEFGIYVGSSVHEVAQVVAIPASIPNANDIMAHNAVIVKMSRVLLIAPMLVILGLILSFTTKKSTQQSKISIPWFAVYFIVVAGFNSLNILPKDVVDTINRVDTFLLTMAMSALGMGTIFKNFKNSGALAFNLALVMFIWLIVGGFVVTKVVTSIF